VLPAAILNYDKHVAFTEQNKDRIEKGTKKFAAKKSKDSEVSEIIDEDSEDVPPVIETTENPEL
jgi:hypothetical protein